jgi:hypothetical protein
LDLRWVYNARINWHKMHPIVKSSNNKINDYFQKKSIRKGKHCIDLERFHPGMQTACWFVVNYISLIHCDLM